MQFAFRIYNLNLITQIPNKMKQILLVALLLVPLVSACHYSCNLCALSFYSSCQTCANNQSIYVLENPSTLPQQYWSSVYPTGACVGVQKGVNAFGIALFILGVTACLILRTKEVFYLFITFQTFGLFSLVEIAWVDGIGYIVQGFQYLMMFSVVGSGYKVDDNIFTISKNFRIKSFLVYAQLGPNIALLAPFTLVALILLIILLVISIKRKKEKNLQKKDQATFEVLQAQSEVNRGNQTPSTERCKCWKDLSQQVFQKAIKFLICFLFLMIQQTALVLLVALVYSNSRTGAMTISIIYLIMLVFLSSCAYYHPIDYFKSKKVMYIAFAKKIILPVMVVVPIRYQFLLFLFIGIFVIVDIGVDVYQDQVYKGINRIAVFKIFQYLAIFICTAYYAVEYSGVGASASKTLSIAATFIISIYLIYFGVEIPFGIKEAFFNKKDAKPRIQIKEEKSYEIKMEDTLQNADQTQFNRNNTLQIIQMTDTNEHEIENIKGRQIKPQPHSKDQIQTQSQPQSHLQTYKPLSELEPKQQVKPESQIKPEKQLIPEPVTIKAVVPEEIKPELKIIPEPQIKPEPIPIKEVGPEVKVDLPRAQQINQEITTVILQASHKNEEEEKQQQLKQEQAAKRKRKQILDPALRLRYGI